MDRVRKIVESLKNKNEEEGKNPNQALDDYMQMKDIDKYCDVRGEDVEWKPIWFDDSPLTEGQLDEASAVTFNKKAYPNEGWCVIMAGGAGSGKGFVIGKSVLIDAKVMDVDELKQLYNRVVTKKAGRDYSKKSKELEYDLKNPDDVADLHVKVDAKGWKDDITYRFFKYHDDGKSSREDRKEGKGKGGAILSNVIFDITGKTLGTLINNSKMAKELGYNVSVVWVVTNREVALARNMLRGRRVPEHIFHSVHNKIIDTVFPFLTDSETAKYVDEAWIVFSGPATSEIEKKTPVTVKDELKDRVFPLKKRGSAFTTMTTIRGHEVDIADAVIAWLGPKEIMGGDDAQKAKKIYKSFGATQKEIDKLKKDAEGEPLPGQKLDLRRKR